MMMLDGKIQKLIMLLDQYIDDSRILRIKPGIDEKLDSLQDEIDDYLEKFAEKQADAAETLGLPPTDVKLEETNSEGYVFRAANRHEPNINKNFDVISIKRACINFTSEKMRSLNSGYLQLGFE